MHILQVGCGVGNTAFPLLELNKQSHVYACDFAPSAVEMVRANPQYSSQRMHAFVADITCPLCHYSSKDVSGKGWYNSVHLLAPQPACLPAQQNSHQCAHLPAHQSLQPETTLHGHNTNLNNSYHARQYIMQSACLPLVHVITRVGLHPPTHTHPP